MFRNRHLPDESLHAVGSSCWGERTTRRCCFNKLHEGQKKMLSGNSLSTPDFKLATTSACVSFRMNFKVLIRFESFDEHSHDTFRYGFADCALRGRNNLILLTLNVGSVTFLNANHTQKPFA